MKEIREEMKESWDSKAVENAYHWVDSTKPVWNNEEEYFKAGLEVVEKELINVLKENNVTETQSLTVLDIGCGTGRLSKGLSQYFSRVVGIDVSEEMVKLARKDLKNVSNVEFVVGNGEDLNVLESDQFDVVFSFIVFQHIPSREVIKSYITEMYRVLKKGGIARFQVRGYPGNLRQGIKSFFYSGFKKFYVALDFKLGFIPFPVLRKYGTVYGAFYKQAELKKELLDSGFEIIDMAQDPVNHRYLWATVRKQADGADV